MKFMKDKGMRRKLKNDEFLEIKFFTPQRKMFSFLFKMLEWVYFRKDFMSLFGAFTAD